MGRELRMLAGRQRRLRRKRIEPMETETKRIKDDSSPVLAGPLLDIDLPKIKRVKSGKVREIFDLGDSLLMVATDRISAFDCIMPNGIPLKGVVLTQISHFWFDQMAAIVPNHLLSLRPERVHVIAES